MGLRNSHCAGDVDDDFRRSTKVFLFFDPFHTGSIEVIPLRLSPMTGALKMVHDDRYAAQQMYNIIPIHSSPGLTKILFGIWSGGRHSLVVYISHPYRTGHGNG